MPLSYPEGTIAEHLACRKDAAAFDVSHLGTVRVEGPGSFELLQTSLTNDLHRIGPGRAQYQHLLDEADASVLDDIIVWWVAEERFDVMPNASNTARVISVLGGHDVTHERAVIAVQGPRARERLATVSPDAAAVAAFRRWRISSSKAWRVVSPAPATPVRTVSSAPCRPRWPPSSGAPSSGPGSSRPALEHATHFASNRGCPLHGHELGAGITPLQAGLGWVVSWDKGPSGVARPWSGSARRGSAPPARSCSPKDADRLVTGMRSWWTAKSRV